MQTARQTHMLSVSSLATTYTVLCLGRQCKQNRFFVVLYQTILENIFKMIDYSPSKYPGINSHFHSPSVLKELWHFLFSE